MQWTLLVAGWAALAQFSFDAPLPPAAEQQPPAAEQQPPAAMESTADVSSAPSSTTPDRHRLTPPEMLAQALTPPPESQLTGRSMPLLEVLSATADPRIRLEATQAYWRLAEAVAVYHTALEQDRRLQGLDPSGEGPSSLRAAQAASKAMVREAEVAAVSAQYDLAGLLPSAPDATLPLPADLPHVGPYRTQFDQLSSMRIVPARARMIDRTLPIRCRAIDRWASAADAAEDALAAAIEAQRTGGTDLSAVVTCIEEWSRGRRAFLRSICRYNQDIADYALAAASPATNPRTLLAMLIRVAPEPVEPPTSAQDGGPQPAGYLEPVTTPGRPGGPREPTPADPSTRPRDSDKEIPTPATQWAPAQPAEPIPTMAEPIPTTVNKPVTDARGRLDAGSLYRTLAAVPPDARASQLTLLLHQDRLLPEGIGRPTSLEDCLRARSGGQRLEAISTYWLTAQRTAEYTALAQQAQWIDAPDAIGTEAALLEAHAALIEAQFELAVQMGRTSDDLWPIPSTAPRAARYPLPLDPPPAGSAVSLPQRRLTALIPGLADVVQQRATALVEADAERASEPSPAAGRRQTEQTFAFLAALTDYNRAVAQHALAVLRPDTPVDELARVLVAVP